MTPVVAIAVFAALAVIAAAVAIAIGVARRPGHVARGSERGHASQTALPEVRTPRAPAGPLAPPEAPPAVAAPAAPVPAAPIRRDPTVAAPPSLVGVKAATEADRAHFVRRYEHRVGTVELGFSDDPERVGIRMGSPAERAYVFYADQLLADLTASRAPRG